MDFTFDALSVTVSSDDLADVEWLEEFMGPTVRADRHGSVQRVATRRIALRADERLYARFTPMLADSRSRAIGFVMDSGTVDLQTFPDGDALVAYDPAFSTFYRITHPHSVEIIDRQSPESSDPRQPRRARGAMMRVLREWVMNCARDSGHLALHAAGIARSGHATLFSGSKRSGKTTLTAACLLDHEEWGLLANDRVVLARRPQDWNCRGIASIVSVRPESLELVAGLDARIRPQAVGSFASVHEGTAPAPLNDGRIGLGPAQFARAVGTTLVGEAALRRVAFPLIDGACRGIRCRRLPPDEAASRVRSALFAAAAPGIRSQLFEASPADHRSSDESLPRQVSDLAAEVECVEIQLGRDAYEPAAIDSLLRSFEG